MTVEPNPGDPAEWAIRWEASEMTSLSSISEPLGVEGKIKMFVVRYYRVREPNAPDGYHWIVRTREGDGVKDRQTTIKLRGPHPFPSWEPPPLDVPVDEAKVEWDLAIGPDGPLRPVYSHSVTLEGLSVVPRDWLIEPWGPMARMHRIKAKKVGTVELWRVGKRRYVEVSRSGRVDGGTAFAEWVAPILGGAVPLAEGMTQIVTGTAAG